MIVVDWYREGRIFAGIDKADLITKDVLSDEMKRLVEEFDKDDMVERVYCEEEDFYVFAMEPVELIHYMGSRDALNFITGV